MATGKPSVRAGPNGSSPKHRVEHDEATDPLQQLAASVAALRAEVGNLAAARIDQFRLAIRDHVFGMVAKCSGLLLGLVVLATALVLIMYGVALGLSEVCGGRMWLGCVLSGVLFLVTTLLVVLLTERGMRIGEYRRMAEKYRRAESGATDTGQDAAHVDG